MQKLEKKNYLKICRNEKKNVIIKKKKIKIREAIKGDEHGGRFVFSKN